jgi:N-hydroxyarylamine O-acetyltransferase
VVPVAAYLARIGYSGASLPTAATLRAIHRAHLFAVPFENLDIALARKIVVEEDTILRKVVELRRGGFCYELNGAFAALLRALGFRITLLSARVSGQGGREGPEFDHLTLRVDLSEPYLADVGFGESFLEPLRLDLNEEQSDPAGRFRIVSSGQRLQLEKFDSEKGWRRQYSFTLEARQIEEFAGMCHYHQTSPQSHFTQNSICTRATPEGRMTLSGMKLILTRNGLREERMLSSEQERADVLRAQFGIVL